MNLWQTPLVFWLILLGTDIACLVFGFMAGRVTRAVVETEQSVREIEENMTIKDDNPSEDEKDADRKHKLTNWFSGNRVLALAVTLVGIMTVAVGITAAVNDAEDDAQRDRIVGCIVGYSNASADAFEQRAAAQSVVNERLDDFMIAIYNAFSSAPAEGRKAILDSVIAFNMAREESKETQRENPLPEAPENACADLLEDK